MTSNLPVVLITGSSGYLGAPLVERLAHRYRVIGLDRPGPPHPPEAAECVEVDLGSDDSVRQGFELVRQHFGTLLASVIHLAAYYDFSGESSPLYDTITVQGTARLLRELQSFSVGQFVFSSTMLVHAPCRVGDRINENAPRVAKWAYPESKIRTEDLIQKEHGPIPYVLLRVAGVYDDRCHSLPLAHQIDRIYERHVTSHVYPGDTRCGQAFLHREDFLEAMERIIDRRSQLPSELPLLLGEEQTLSYEELQRTFGRLIHNEDWTTAEIPKALAKTGAWLQDALPLAEDPFIKPYMIDLADDHYALDMSRARSVLGWQPRHSLRETLPKMIDALKADPAGWYAEHELAPPSNLEPEPAAEPA